MTEQLASCSCRVAAIVLPRLACEIAESSGNPLVNRALESRARSWGLAVIVSDDARDDDSGAALVAEVDDTAFARGVRPGMRVSEAMTRTSEIRFARVSPRAILAALEAIADIATGFGAIVEIAPPDTVWVDISGVAHIFGGEQNLVRELTARVSQFSFHGPERAANNPVQDRVQVAIACGPNTARAIARHASRAVPVHGRIVPPGFGETRRAIAPLPLAALGLGPAAISFFAKLGVSTIGDLMEIESGSSHGKGQLAARLEPFVATAQSSETISVRSLLSWLSGNDKRPLRPYVPAQVLSEEIGFDDNVETAPQLLFVARSMASQISSRLVGRRQAANRLELELRFDRSIVFEEALQSMMIQQGTEEIEIDLPAPLCHTEDLFRAVKAKLENKALAAPVRGFELRASRIVPAPEIQLDLSRDVSVHPDALPALLSELSADIGADQVGILQVCDDFRPERQSRIDPAASGRERAHATSRSKASKQDQLSFLEDEDDSWAYLRPAEPLRLLPNPLPLDDGKTLLQPGSILSVEGEMFTVESVTFDRRLDGIAWWTSEATARDYVRVDLSFPKQKSDARAIGVERNVAAAWIFVDRRTGQAFLQGWWD